MKWYAVIVKTKEEHLDQISSYFHQKGSNGVLIEDFKPLDLNKSTGEVFLETEKKSPGYIYVKGYFNSYLSVIDSLKQKFREEIIDVSVEAIDEDWKEKWKKSFKRIQVTKNILIKPSWDLNSSKSMIEVSLDPGMAFGTGTHETTQLTIEKLEKFLKKGDKVLDLGCGSGILSIVASKLEAKHITAIDIDDDSIIASKENFRMNDVRNVTLLKGKLGDIYFEKADIIVANILSGILIKLLDDIIKCSDEETFFISSGISIEELQRIKKLYEKKGLKIIEVSSKGRWCVIVAKKQ